MSEVVKIRIEGVKRQIDTLASFVKEPKGIFETADAIVKNFRNANRETVKAIKERRRR